MLSKKQISNISILSIGIAVFATFSAPPVASTLLVFAGTFAISAMALSLITSISNIISEGRFNERSNSFDADLPDRGPIHIVHHKPSAPAAAAVHVVDHNSTPNAVHIVHNNPKPAVVHIVHNNPTPAAAYVFHNKAAPTNIHVVQAAHHVRRSQPVTAAGTKIPANASNISRVRTVQPGVSKASEQPKESVVTLHQTTVTGTNIPDVATNVKRHITTAASVVKVAPIVAAVQKKSIRQEDTGVKPADRKHGESVMSNRAVIIERKRAITPQADRMRTQRGGPNVSTLPNVDSASSKLSDKVIIRQRKA